MPDFTATQPHINTGLVAVSMSEQGPSSVTTQQSSCEQGCRFFGRVPRSAGHAVCSVNWFCLFSIRISLVCWRKCISLCSFSHQPISVTPFMPSFRFLLSPTFLYSSFCFPFFASIPCVKIVWVNTAEKAAAVLLQAWSGPEGSRKLRFPDFMTAAQDGGKVVSLTHHPPLPPGNKPGTHFC
jgi:hypothetical protein